MANNIVGFPGVRLSTLPGAPRHDIADMLRKIADRAERGEIDSGVLIYSEVGPEGGTGFSVFSPDNAPNSIIAKMELIKFRILQQQSCDIDHGKFVEFSDNDPAS